MAAERASSPEHELFMELSVQRGWKKMVRRRPEHRVLTGNVPIIPDKAPRVRAARIGEALLEMAPKISGLLEKSIND